MALLESVAPGKLQNTVNKRSSVSSKLHFFMSIVFSVYRNMTSLFVCLFVCYSQNGASPLLVASEKGNLAVVRTLLKYNARVDVFDEVCIEALLIILYFLLAIVALVKSHVLSLFRSIARSVTKNADVDI